MRHAFIGAAFIGTVAALALTPDPANATNWGEAPAGHDIVQLRYTQSDLVDDRAIEKLYSKINRRTLSYCSRPYSTKAGVVKVCRADLADQFVAQIGDPRLTRLHKQRKGSAWD